MKNSPNIPNPKTNVMEIDAVNKNFIFPSITRSLDLSPFFNYFSNISAKRVSIK